MQHTELGVGDTIRLGEKPLQVVGVIDVPITINNDGFANGVQILVNDELYGALIGDDNYSEVYPTLRDKADTDTFESWLGNLCGEYPGIHWLSYLQSIKEMAESFEQINMLWLGC